MSRAKRVFSAADLMALPRDTVQARFHDGPLLTFEGVTLHELLVRSGVPADLRSGDLTRYVVVEAADTHIKSIEGFALLNFWIVLCCA